MEDLLICIRLMLQFTLEHEKILLIKQSLSRFYNVASDKLPSSTKEKFLNLSNSLNSDKINAKTIISCIDSILSLKFLVFKRQKPDLVVQKLANGSEKIWIGKQLEHYPAVDLAFPIDSVLSIEICDENFILQPFEGKSCFYVQILKEKIVEDGDEFIAEQNINLKFSIKKKNWLLFIDEKEEIFFKGKSFKYIRHFKTNLAENWTIMPLDSELWMKVTRKQVFSIRNTLKIRILNESKTFDEKFDLEATPRW